MSPYFVIKLIVLFILAVAIMSAYRYIMHVRPRNRDKAGQTEEGDSLG